MQRRFFIKLLGLTVSVFNTRLLSQDNNEKVLFNHGVASGDPTHDRVIIWTKITKNTNKRINVNWQVSNKEDFSNIIDKGLDKTSFKKACLLEQR